MARLSKDEMETIVNFSDAKDNVTVYSASPTVITKLKKLGYPVVSKDKVSCTFNCPKRCISFRNIQKKVMSEETKEKMKKARAKAKATKEAKV